MAMQLNIHKKLWKQEVYQIGDFFELVISFPPFDAGKLEMGQ